MALLKIIKLSTKTWKHNSNIDGDFILTKFYAKQENTDFLLVESYGAKRRKYKINEIEVYNIGGTAETFTNFEDLFLRLEELNYPAFYVDGEFIFNPSNYDLEDFTNESLNLFVREDELNFLSNNPTTYPTATTPIADTDQLFVIQGGVVKKVDKSEIGGGGTNLDTILNNLGVFVKFNQASASHYPFVGVAVNSGTIQGVAINDNLITKYSNAFVRIQASTSANTGYRMTDGNTYPTALLEGVTYFSIMCPLSVTNTAIVYGMPATNTLTTTSEVLSSGAWFSITGNQLQAKCAYSSVMSAGSSVTINVNEWLLSTIEVIENNASTKKIRFKVRKIDGTLIYNEDITSNIQPYNVYNGMSTGFRAIRTTTGSTENIFGLQAIGFWAEKPNFLKDF